MHKKGRFVLGFDETNNGFNLDSPDYKPHANSILVITGYLVPDIGRANYGCCKYEHKKKIFNSRRDLDRALFRGKYYIGSHPDFFYTTIPRQSPFPMTLMRANAVALLTFQFAKAYNLDPNKTTLVLDEMNGKENSKFINHALQFWLEQARFTAEHYSKEKADEKTIAVKIADRIGYYVSAIKFLGTNQKWPFRSRKVSINNLEQLAIDLAERPKTREYTIVT